MGRQPTGDRRQRGLVLWVIFCSGIAIRDLWLATHGGGATPRWLLRAETAAFGVSAIGGLAALELLSRATDGAGSRLLKAATPAAGVAASVMHGLRLALYLRAQREKPG